MDKGGILLSRNTPIFYSAILLTLVNLILRFAGTSFQIYISNRIGPSGVGLLQLVMSVGSLTMIAGIAGIRTAAMYLTAEELGKKRFHQIPWVLSGCFLYSILCSGTVAVFLYLFAPEIARFWIGEPNAADSLRMYAAFLPATCLCGVMSGYFTAANRIGTLAAVEIAEQFFSMSITVFALKFWAGQDPSKACQSVILGSSAGCSLTLILLLLLQVRQRQQVGTEKLPIAGKLLQIAVPLALADILKAGISTAENLMVPKRLRRNISTADPLAAFGTVTGMIFPVIMFPACILYGLAELLIPELARCSASGSRQRILYLTHRSLKVTMLYGIVFGGLLFLLSDELVLKLYKNMEAAPVLKAYALLVPMLYCDAIVDAMTKGLGQQKICVRYNILTSTLDIILLFYLLPKYGMKGYYVSFLATHLINFLLSLSRLLKITNGSILLHEPLLSIIASTASVSVVSVLHNTFLKIPAYLAVLFSLLYLFRIVSREDLQWLTGLCKIPPIRKKRTPAA